ncbi:MAG: zinc-ribbon domain-containing protein, partial [Candidatus Thermoplasmatota archaeon]
MHDQKRAAAELKEVKEMTPPPTRELRQEPEIPVATEGELYEAVEAFDSLLGLKERECPLCGQPILPDAQVCPVCGTSLANVPAGPRP